MLPETWTILKILKWTTAYFQSHQIDQPRAAAEMLLSHTLRMRRIDLYIQYDRPLEQLELETFRGFIQRRLQREPVAYIVGHKEFWSMDLDVTSDVLIPRPETEILVERALVHIPPESPQLNVLDLGTGSGAIVLAMASERPGHDFCAIDRSPGALSAARANAKLKELDQGISFIQGNWFEPVRDKGRYFNLVVSNPPYISDDELEELSPEITQYEPLEALRGGADGLEAIRLIVNEASAHTVPGGWLLFEIGHNQRPAVEELIVGAGAYEDCMVFKDYSGCDRVVQARVV